MTTTKLSLTDRGAGEPVVLLHSGGMSSRQWRLLADVLSARWRVITPDLLGSGANPPWPDDAPFEIQMEVDAVLASLPETRSVHFVGHSYGAMVALKIAEQHPTLVRSLSLYEPPAFGVLYDPADPEGLAEIEKLEVDSLFADDERGGTEPWFRVFVDFWNGAGAWERLPEPNRAAFLRVGRKVYREVRALMADRTGAKTYASVHAPALLMGGGLSPLAERRVMARLAESLANASRLTLEKAGHMGPLTHSADVNDAIAHHLAYAAG